MNFYNLLNIAKNAVLETPTIFFAPLLVSNDRPKTISSAQIVEKSQNRFIVRKHLKEKDFVDFSVLKYPKYSRRNHMSTEDMLILSYEINKLKETPPDTENELNQILDVISQGGGKFSVKPKRHSPFKRPSKKYTLF